MTGDWSNIRCIAHRCGGAMAPENSLAGLGVAARLGIGAVEFDVMLSADGDPFLIHDETLERTTQGTGRVAETASIVLDTLSCARGWGPPFDTERVPRLELALTKCYALGLLPNVEIKPSAGHEEETGKVVAGRALATWSALGGAPNQVMFSSFSKLALDAARAAAPMLRCALLLEEVCPDGLDDASRIGAEAVHCSRSMATSEWVREALGSGLDIRVYTVNEAAEALVLWKAGVLAVFSDQLSEIARALPGRAGLTG